MLAFDHILDGLGITRTSQYVSRYMGHDSIISQYTVIPCILRYIVIFPIVHWKCKNSAEIQAAVYDLGSPIKSHQIMVYW